MDDLGLGSVLPLLDNLSVTRSAASEDNQGTSGASQSEFQDLLAAMLLSSFANQSSSSSSDNGFGFQQLMAPLMLNLLEKLLSNQVEDSTQTSETTETIKTETKAVNKPSGMPVKGPITQYPSASHMALDIGVSIGTKVKATMDGKVVYAGWNNEGYGNLVIVENGPWKTYFAHLSKIPVEVGNQVSAGEVVGISGSTGNSTGSHLHYEVRKNGTAIDPSGFTLSK